MNELTPFSESSLSKNISVKTKINLKSPLLLTVEFQVKDPNHSIKWPSKQNLAVRADDLWKTTCLETFFSSGKTNEDAYVETNCSPNGNWNAYSFTRYREGMTPSSEIHVELKEIQDESKTPLSVFLLEIRSTEPLKIKSISTTMVIEYITGEKSYWALRHPSPNADFHNKEVWEQL